MNFLQKILKAILAFAKIETGLAPLISPIIPVKSNLLNEIDDLTSIMTTVTSAATVLSVAGKPDQLVTAAAPLVAQILHKSEIMFSKKIMDQALFESACQKYVDATIDFLKSIGE